MVRPSSSPVNVGEPLENPGHTVSRPPPSRPAELVHPRAAFRHRDFRLSLGASVASVLGMQMQSVAIGWQVYDLTHRPLDLGFVGLAQFVPAISLSLVAGQTADRYDRRSIIRLCQLAQA